MDCPECAKNGTIVAMKKDRGSRPGRRPERAEAVFIVESSRIEEKQADTRESIGLLSIWAIG